MCGPRVAYSLENYDNSTRYNFNAIVSAYDLADSYLPAFKRTVQTGGALGIMCSYNSINGVPSCANNALIGVCCVLCTVYCVQCTVCCLLFLSTCS